MTIAAMPRCVAEIALNYEQERYRYAAPLARPPPGSALGTPARHGRAAAVSLRRSITLTRHA
jgi:hypothetical protein